MEIQKDIKSFKNIHHHLGLLEEWRIATPDATVLKQQELKDRPKHLMSKCCKLEIYPFQRRLNKTQPGV